MVKKYFAASWCNKITEVEVERESATSVWINGRVSRKSTTSEAYLDTWEEAHAFLMGIAQTKYDSAKRAYDYANSKLGNVKGMKKPE